MERDLILEMIMKILIILGGIVAIVSVLFVYFGSDSMIDLWRVIGLLSVVLVISFVIVLAMVKRERRNRIVREGYDDPELTSSEISSMINEASEKYMVAKRLHREGRMKDKDFHKVIDEYKIELTAIRVIEPDEEEEEEEDEDRS